MLRVAEHSYGTDVGRMRRGNEDNFYARTPLFAVCDGMGGAQAGEVASEIAARSFDRGLPNGAPPEEGLREIIAQANARIHALSRTDAGRAGMGTTCTAAYVDEDGVAIAHVGDSRAYRVRNGEIERLTKDHSLVGEMIDQGKITEEQAESHPHRSIITRALGPEPDVNVDTSTWTAQPDDLYMLCSDGLTSMVPEARLKPILAANGSLKTKVKELIAAANAAGGRDNITVILFRLDEVPEVAAGTANGGEVTSEIGAVDSYQEYDESRLADPKPRQGITKAEAASLDPGGGPRTADVGEAVRRADEEEYLRKHGTVALTAITPAQRKASPGGEQDTAEHHIRPGPAPVEAPQPAAASAPLAPAPEAPPPVVHERRPAKKRSARRGPIKVLIVLVVLLVLVVAGLWLASRAVYFVGTDENRAQAVTIYRGLPYELPLGIDLYEPYYTSGVRLGAVPPDNRATFTDHKLRSLNDAKDLVTKLEKGQLE